MIVILSPAKTLNFKTDSPIQKYSKPLFIKQAEKLVDVLKNYSPSNLMELMGISNGLAELNYLRFQRWEPEHRTDNSKQAIFAFNGEVYNGLQANTLDTEQLLFAQKHIRLLSGLYGVLCPLDLIQPYRLEMGTHLSFSNYKNLYQFWNGTINNFLNNEIDTHKSKTIINLASYEYAKSVRLKAINGKVVTPVFKEYKRNQYQVITVYAKKARGLMTRFIIENKIESPANIKHFDIEGYAFTESLSNESEWVFTR
jgi:cytoplasmic iron level regulating protein YaaA (DUF328/UPF0246 family)